MKPSSSLEARLHARLRLLADHPAAAGLADDVAHLDGRVLTHDTIVEGVHYRADDPPESVGWKLAAVNLSDLAAKGARPVGALLSLTIGAPLGDSEAGEWEERFLAGLAAAGESYGLPLIGGDTVALPSGAPRVLGLTAIGEPAGPPPRRDGARDGDLLLLVGTLGGAMAGLEALDKDAAAEGPLVDIYRRPVPLLAAGQALAPFAHAMMDVSDGLLLDARRMAQASGLGASIDLGALPLEAAFVAEKGDTRASRLFAATGGDDYALLAAIAPEDEDVVRQSLPRRARVEIVGRLASGTGLALTHDGEPVALPERLGHEHDRD
ncbi:thiamine-phosphate kinase [Sphingomicrobium aestuariivivum]|uniref:thiamine-phosphate kinase n=1 Tax=Sphingomicrobium aestuariivivum TaxID=1582356 RepID=UPI001FD6DA96|nr:thiamine-phosphate kinase [Sphingomicrobium aestuariivivum]MCJ8190952.1 thiamine-phosphate kinase [Sphingomicrobium aestuariivivum]